MTQYMIFQLQIEKLERLGAATQNGCLKTFYANAVQGFRLKQSRLSLAQANGFVIE